MQFQQHVYGRVSRGAQGWSPGYQLAAVSEAIKEKIDMLDNLNKNYSFLKIKDDDKRPVRYSFFRPHKDFIAFGAVCYAMGLDGAIGTFAHHYLCTNEEFIHSKLSPINILKSLTFFKSEEDLPEDRILEEFVLTPIHEELSPVKGKWSTIAFKLADNYFAKKNLIIPLVISSDAEMWEILTDLFHLLPRQEIMDYRFSSYFMGFEGQGVFRVAFVPSFNHIPHNQAGYRVIRPILSEEDENLSKQKSLEFQGKFEISKEYENTYKAGSPLTSFWEKFPHASPDLVNLIDTLRHSKNRIHDAKTINTFGKYLSYGKDFRDCLESLKVPNYYSLLLTNEHWVIDFYKAGSPIKFEDILETIWELPQIRLTPLLKALHSFSDDQLKKGALKSILKKYFDKEWPFPDFSVLSSTNHLEAFCDLAIEHYSILQLCDLAQLLNDDAFYRFKIQRFIASKILQKILNENSPSQEFNYLAIWLNKQALEIKDNYVSAVSELGLQFIEKNAFRFNIKRFNLSKEEYSSVVSTIVTSFRQHKIKISLPELLSALFTANFQGEFTSVFLQNWQNWHPDFQLQILGFLGSLPNLSADNVDKIAQALVRMNKPVKFVEYFLTVLNKHQSLADLPRYNLTQLNALVKSGKGFFRW